MTSGRLPSLTPSACGPGATLTASWSRVEVAGPRRFLSLDVRNCSGSAVALPARPDLSALDANGDPVDLRRVEMPSTRDLTLSPADHAYLNLSWLAGPRCEQGAQHLVAKIPEAAAATSDDCLQLGSAAGSPEIRIGWDSEPFR